MLRTRGRAVLITVFVAGIALAACGSDATDATVRTGSQPAATAAPAPTTNAGASDSAPDSVPDASTAAAVPAALQFRAPLVGGGEFDGNAAAGRPVAFWFWAPT